MRKYLLALLILTTLCFGKNPLDYVDPFIGTDGHGHTFPGATLPFGMVQLSPSNDFKAWDWCSGYHYSDSVLKGFAHTHISGPGLAGLGDILLMPTVGKILTDPGTEQNPENGYRSRFSHENETASPGYYQVLLVDYDVNVELTCTERVGFHRYRFPKSDEANIIFDPTHHIAESIFDANIEFVSENKIRGYKESKGEAGTRKVYFIAQFSKKPKKIGITSNGKIVNKKSSSGKKVKGFVQFSTEQDEEIEVHVAISHVSFEGAEKNLIAETKNKNFDKVVAEAKTIWTKQLSKIDVNMLSEKDKTIFYTGLYHSSMSPNLYMDVDGKYKINGKVYSSNHPQYSMFSTWDTFRATHPLYTIINQKITTDMVNSMVDRDAVNEVGLPLWELYGYDNRCMPGYSTVPVIADAILKDIPGIDKEAAFTAIYNAAFNNTKSSPNYDVNGIDEYIALGYVPMEIGSSISKTTEYCYYDWCIARVAEKLGKTKEQKMFDDRAKYFASHFYKENGYLWPKSSTGDWLKKMDLTVWDDGLIRNYVSGNIWAYSTFVPHGIPALIKLHGNEQKFAEFLDGIIADTTSLGGNAHVDISGFIGKYGHGDEPGHHLAYLYNYVGQPWKSQKLIREVMEKMYFDTPKGFENNEDLGQMSSWYLFSALGFYPVCPGDGKYILGSPLVNDAEINLENGKTFKIITKNNSKKNQYIQSVNLNGKKYTKTYISHDDIMTGGLLEFVMGDKPKYKYGSKKKDYPDYKDQSKVQGKIIVKSPSAFMPFETEIGNCFAESRIVELHCNTNDVKIYFTTDGTSPSEKSNLYTKPLQLDKYTNLKAIAIAKDLKPSPIFKKEYFPSLADGKNEYPKIKLLTPNHNYGNNDGSMLIDGKIGSLVFSDGKYTGFLGSDMVAVIDLGESRKISNLSIGVLDDMKVWIFPAIGLKIETSDDNENFEVIASRDLPMPDHEVPANLARHQLEFDSQKTRYIKVTVQGTKKCPEFHAGAGIDSFLFVDEIMVY